MDYHGPHPGEAIVVGRCDEVMSYVDSAFHAQHTATHCWVEGRDGAATCLHCCVRYIQSADEVQAKAVVNSLLHALSLPGIVKEMAHRGGALPFITLVLCTPPKAQGGPLATALEDLVVCVVSQAPCVAATPAFLNALWAVFCDATPQHREALVGLLVAVLSEAPDTAEILAVTGARLLHALSMLLQHPPGSDVPEATAASVLYVFLKVAHTANAVDVFVNLGRPLFSSVTAALARASPGSVLCVNAVALLNACSHHPEVVHLLPLSNTDETSLIRALSRMLTQKGLHVQRALVVFLCSICTNHGGTELLADTLLPEYLLECLQSDDTALVSSACQLLETLHSANTSVLKLRHAVEVVVDQLFRVTGTRDDGLVVPVTSLLATLLDTLERRGFEDGTAPDLRPAVKTRLTTAVQLVVVGEEGEAVSPERVSQGIAAMGSCVRLRCIECAELLCTASQCAVEADAVLCGVVMLCDAASESTHTLHLAAAPSVLQVHRSALRAALRPHPPPELTCSLLSLAHNVLSPQLLEVYGPHLLTATLMHSTHLPEAAGTIAMRCLKKLLLVWGADPGNWNTREDALLPVCGSPEAVLRALGEGSPLTASQAVDVLRFDFEYSESLSFDPREVLRLAAALHQRLRNGTSAQQVVRLAACVRARCGLLHEHRDTHNMEAALRAAVECHPAADAGPICPPPVLAWAVHCFGLNALTTRLLLLCPAAEPYTQGLAACSAHCPTLVEDLLQHLFLGAGNADSLDPIDRERLLAACIACVAALGPSDPRVARCLTAMRRCVSHAPLWPPPHQVAVLRLCRSLLQASAIASGPSSAADSATVEGARAAALWAADVLQATTTQLHADGDHPMHRQLLQGSIDVLDVLSAHCADLISSCPSLFSSLFASGSVRQVLSCSQMREALLRILCACLRAQLPGCCQQCPAACFASLFADFATFTHAEREQAFAATAALLALGESHVRNFDLTLFLHAALQAWAEGPEDVRRAVMQAVKALPAALSAQLAQHPSVGWLSRWGGGESADDAARFFRSARSPYVAPAADEG